MGHCGGVYKILDEKRQIGSNRGKTKKYHMKEGSERTSELLQRTRIPLGSSCDGRFRKSSCCSLQHSEEMKRKKVRGRDREGKSERETGTNCYQISL